MSVDHVVNLPSVTMPGVFSYHLGYQSPHLCGLANGPAYFSIASHVNLPHKDEGSRNAQQID